MTVLSDKCISYHQVVTLYIYGHCCCIWQMERRWILPLLLGHHSKSKINFPYWNVSPNSGGAVFVYRWAILLAAEWSCTCLRAWSFRVMPKSFIFLTAFGIYFLITHLLPSAVSVALNAFRNVRLENWYFSAWNFMVFSVTYCIENMLHFFQPQQLSVPLFVTNFPAWCMSVTDIEAGYLVGVRLTLIGVLHGVELLLWHSPFSRCYLISSRNLIK